MKKIPMNAKIKSDGYIEMFAVLSLTDLGHDKLPKISALFGEHKEAVAFVEGDTDLLNPVIQKINLGNIVVPSVDELEVI